MIMNIKPNFFWGGIILLCFSLNFYGHGAVKKPNSTINLLADEEQTLKTLSQTIFQQLPEYANPNFYSYALHYLKQIFTYSDIETLIDKFLHRNQATLGDEDQWTTGTAPNAELFDSSTHINSLNNLFIEKQKINESSKLCVIGDIHGSVHTLLRTLWRLAALKYIDLDLHVKNKNFYFIFTGDYVDRGLYSIEVLYILILLKLRNWNNVFIIRGNHEYETTDKNNIFYQELSTKYDDDLAQKFMNLFAHFYGCLPYAVFFLCGNTNIIQCCHSGIIATYDPHNFDYHYEPCKDYNHFIWTDLYQPDYHKKPTSEKHGKPISIISVINYMIKHDIKAMFRGHQDLGFGCKMFFDDPIKFAEYDNNVSKPINYPYGPYNWRSVVGEKATAKVNGFKISNNIPVFTFSTATEFRNDAFDCFGILTTHPSYDKWRLKVYEYKLKSSRNNCYISEISMTKQTDNPSINPINFLHTHDPHQLRIQGFF